MWNRNGARLIFYSLLAILSVACTGLAGEPEIVSTLPVRPTALPETIDATVNLDAGALIFAENCVRCHGVNGAGDGELVQSGQVTNVPDFTDPATIQNTTLQEWFDVITNGRIEALMPPWSGSLSAQERWNVALYTYTLSYKPQHIETGQQLYSANCLDCHGENGQGTDKGSSLLGLVSYAEAGLAEQINTHQAELDTASNLSADDLTAITQYLRLLSTQSGQLSTVDTSIPLPDATEEAQPDNADPHSDVPQAIGTLHGQIIQGTAGGGSVEGLEAIIHIFDSSLQEQIGEYIVGADGTYQYDEVVIRPDYAYMMTVLYNNTEFASDILIGDTNITDMELNVTIYESTDDPSVVKIVSRATQVNLSPQGLYVIEVIDLVNSSDRLLITDRRDEEYGFVSLEFPIPDGAQLQTTHTDPNRYRLTEDRRTVLDTYPVLPDDEHYVQFSYSLPFDQTVTINQPIDYAVAGSTEFYIENRHLSLQGNGIDLLRTQIFNGTEYNVYQVNNAPSIGDSLAYDIVLTQSTSTTTSQGVPREALAVVFVVIGVGFIALAGLIIWRSRKTVEVFDTDDRTPQDIMQEIAQLDNRFEDGELSKSDYQKQRNFLKAQLMEKMKAGAIDKP